MIIQMFSGFAKKDNSTKRPSGTVDLSLNGTLKEPCSITRPIFKIENLSPDVTHSVYTYASIPAFHRFYFIADWKWVDGLWECTMEEDVLATWKNEIGNATEYVLRTDSTTDYNGDVSDTTYPATTDFVRKLDYAPVNAFVTDLTAGCYVVGIISGGTSSGSAHSVGAITYYAMTASEFEALKSMLFSEDNLGIMGIIDTSTTPPTPLVSDVSQEVLKTMYNPYQYIVSCVWFPFDKTLIPSSQRTDVTAFYIGWWGYPLSGSRINAQVVELGGETITLTSHPQSATRGSYLNYAPYTQRTLIGRFGTIPLDTSYLKLSDQIRINYMFDLISGVCRCTIDARYDTGSSIAYDTIAVRNFLAGVPVQLAQVGIDYLGTAVSALNTVNGVIGGAVSGFMSGGIAGAVTGAISSTANGIYNTLQSAMPQVETSGSNGSFLSPSLRTYILTHHYKIVDEDIAHRGRPLCAMRQLNTLTGFILCADGELDISCLDEERNKINEYLTTGFFWE